MLSEMTHSRVSNLPSVYISKPTMKATYTLTPKTLKIGARIHYAHRANVMAVVRIVIGAILFAMGAMNICFDPTGFLNYILLILGLLNLFAKQIWIQRSVNNTFKDGSKEVTIAFTANPGSIDIQSEDSKGKLKWSSFVDYLVHDQGLLLYPEKSLYHWIPRTAHFSDGDWDEFIALASKKIKRKL